MQKLKFQYSKNRKGYYTFLCDCGSISIKRGDTTAKHCGQCELSAFIQHGESHTRLYSIWSGMRDRCYGTHKSNTTYKHKYINICPDWDSFMVFKTWAENNGYSDTLTIDRKDISGNYEPSNCEWVTRAENTRRQVADGHSNSIAVKVYTNNALLAEYGSIAKAVDDIYLTMNIPIKKDSFIEGVYRMFANNQDSYRGFKFIRSEII